MIDIIEELSKMPQVMNVTLEYNYIQIILKGSVIRYSVLSDIDKILYKYDYYLYSVSICCNHEQLQILGLR